MKKFKEFVNEQSQNEQPIFTWERAKRWYGRIKQDPDIQKWIGVMVMSDDNFKKYKREVKKVLYKYKDHLYPKEIEYIQELLLDLPFDFDDVQESLKPGQKSMPGTLGFPEIGTNEHPDLRVENDFMGYRIAEEHLKNHPQVIEVHSKEEYEKAIQSCRFFTCGHSWVRDEHGKEILPHLDMLKQFGFVFGVFDEQEKIGYVIPYDKPDRKKY